ncbi:MAG: ABC transporter permease [Asticcacaulis sp.]
MSRKLQETTTVPSGVTPEGFREWPGVREWLRRKQFSGRTGAQPDTVWRNLLRKPGAVFGLAILVFLAFIAVFASVLYPGDPMNSVAQPLLSPGENAAYPLGTDSLGRDVAAAVVHGARTSLSVGVVASVIGLFVGIVLGALAGYFGGFIDLLLMRITELFQTTPMFLLIVVLVALFQPTAAMISVAIGLTTWETIARLVRAEFRQLLQSDFVVAARASGFGSFRIIVREILPNVMPSLIVMISFKVAAAIFMESGLAFLGLGDPNAVSWGAMINEGRDFLRTAWYLTVVPSVAIVVTVLALNLVGDALNDVLNPRLRKAS